MDLWILEDLNGPANDHAALGELVRLVAGDVQYLLVALLACLALATGRLSRLQGRRAVVAALGSAALGLALAHLIGDLWDRPRPYEAHVGAHLLLSPSPDSSFPSDHAVAAFAIAASIALRHRRAGAIALVMAGAICFARVAAATHYPSDVLAGAAIGASAALLLWLPPLGPRVDALADAAGRLYETFGSRLHRRLIDRP